MKVAEIADELARSGFAFRCRPTQAVSDALRTEVTHGRVTHLDHGTYAIGRVTDRHLRYAQQCIRELRRTR